MKPRIAIPQPHSASAEYVARVLPHYFRAVDLAGGEPVEIPLEPDNHQIARLATTCDAVLLPGSRADINPEKYGAARDPHTAPDDPLRDNVDELLLQDAYNMHKPLLGICFGLQSLNVWRTGSLVQHLSGPVRHSGNSHNPAPPHRIVIATGSRLAALIKELIPDSEANTRRPQFELTVNSSHHQAAAAVGDGLRAVAWCPDDNVIEALEGDAPDHWVVAVQWHPERMPDDSAARALFRAFITAARERRLHPRTTTLDFESLSQ
jgi:putative glutamine amidotransferase